MPHRLLVLERLGDDSFLAETQWRGYDRLYGGQVAAQSLRAVCTTVGPDRLPHSLHSYFILAGRAGEPVQLDVQRTRDGRSFSTRHVTASQGGKAIFELVCSFHVEEEGDEWQLPPPDDLTLPDPPTDGSMPRWDGVGGLFEIRPVRPLPEYDPFALHPVWLRTAERLDDDPVTHLCLLTFLSDLGVLGSTRAPGSRTAYRSAASLDHSVWFHRPVRVDEWLRFSSAPVTNHGARGMARAELHTQAGVHVASVAQESLLRPSRDRRARGSMSTGPGAWPAEDGGPARAEVASGPVPAGNVAAVRDVAGAAMAIVRAPGEVFLYGSVLAADSTAWVERLDPHTLDPVARVELPGGPWWPGGLAAHADGSLHLVHGRHAHRLSPALDVLASAVLPRDRPHNSFVTLPDGRLVTKDLGLDRQQPAHLVVLDPETLDAVAEVDAREPSIARLSALGDQVYLVGDDTVFRYRWDGRALAPDETWSFRYRTAPDQSYGWDPVLAGGQVWFLDNGEHTFAGSMLGQGVAAGPVHLVRVGIADAADHELVEVSGRAAGAVTNPPVYDAARRIAVGYDSANGVLAAFDFDGALRLRWRRDLATAGHLLLYADAGVVMAYDHTAAGEDVVFLDVSTGEERARLATGSVIQSVVFPAADGAGAAYYVSFGRVARIT